MLKVFFLVLTTLWIADIIRVISDKIDKHKTFDIFEIAIDSGISSAIESLVIVSILTLFV